MTHAREAVGCSGDGTTSGQALTSPRLLALCELAYGGVAVRCINIGTVIWRKRGKVTRRQPVRRLRPTPADFFSVLGEASALRRV